MSTRSRRSRLQHHISGHSHRRERSHLRQKHPSSRSGHPRWSTEGWRPTAGGICPQPLETQSCFMLLNSSYTLTWIGMVEFLHKMVVVSAAVDQREGCGFDTGPRILCVEFACFSCDCMGSVQVLWLPLTSHVQKKCMCAESLSLYGCVPI